MDSNVKNTVETLERIKGYHKSQMDEVISCDPYFENPYAETEYNEHKKEYDKLDNAIVNMINNKPYNKQYVTEQLSDSNLECVADYLYNL